ncbi:hypothetical protein AAG906_041116 [Vitis piasezkii]
MTTIPTLAMPNFQQPFTIESDASGDGIGAVLTQQGKPVAFMSRALGVSKLSWSTYAKEMLAIIHAIRTWRPYLLGQKFYIQTDQGASKQQKWVAKLLGYDYEILYKPGRENSAANALSREEIKTTTADDAYMARISKLAATKPGLPYTNCQGLTFYKNRVVVPPQSHIPNQLLREFHDSPLGGHSGVLRTYKRIAQQFYWPSMYRMVNEYVSSCDVCQRAKASTLSPAGLLQPLPIPCQVWDDITMDFIEGLPPSQGKNTILVVVDRLSKSAHFLALTHPFSAKMVAEKFVDGVVKLHGMPSSIISDRDPIFISNFWREFFKLSGTQLKMSSAYHPQTDGQTEVVNRCVEQYLRCLVHQQPRKWYSLLPWAEFWYNTAYHASTGMSPFQALYGRPPPMIPHYQLGSSPVNEVDQNLASRNDLLHQLKLNLHQASNRMKQIADSKRRDIEFNEGDLVFLRLHPYRQQTMFKRAFQKLAHRFYGPFPIEKRIGKVAYQLQLPAGLAFIQDSMGKFFEECLVKWKNLPVEDATWENAAELHDRFPDLNLEDKVPVKVGGIDKPRRTHRVSRPNQKYLD